MSPEREQSLSCPGPKWRAMSPTRLSTCARRMEGGGTQCHGGAGSSMFGSGAPKGQLLGAVASVLTSWWCEEHKARGKEPLGQQVGVGEAGVRATILRMLPGRSTECDLGTGT